MKKTPSVLSWQLSAGGRTGSDLISLPRTGAFPLQPPPRSLKEGLRGRRVWEKEKRFASWPVPSAPVEIFRARKRCVPSTTASLSFP